MSDGKLVFRNGDEPGSFYIEVFDAANVCKTSILLVENDATTASAVLARIVAGEHVRLEILGVPDRDDGVPK